MNCYRVTYYSNNILPGSLGGKVETATIWVEANNSSHAIAEATMLACAGTGNEVAQKIGEWMRTGNVRNVYSVIETN